MNTSELIRVYFVGRHGIALELSWILALVAGVVVTMPLLIRKFSARARFEVVDLNIRLGNVGEVTLRPNWKDVEIAHQIWTELVTRKAAIDIDPDNDLIIEIYDSWYQLFQRIRTLVAAIPAPCLRRESTQLLVTIATDTLNKGLRPHLTRWQARFRNWWRNSQQELGTRTPQEQQRQFPEYDSLLSEMCLINKQLVQYAAELQKIVNGQD